jgi:hypothetical protein
MKSLVLLVAILALCVPGYGAVVVYKLGQTDNPVIDFADDNENTADLFKTKIQAFIVFDADVTGNYDVTVLRNDANDPTAVVVFRKDKQFMILGGSDPNSNVRIGNFHSNDSIAPFAVLNKRNTLETLLFIDIRDDDTDLRLEAFDLIGKNTSASIGLADKVSLAKSLRGVSELNVHGPGPIFGFGKAKLTLNSKYTKLANKNGLTVVQTVAAITEDLSKLTLTETLPPID